MRINSKKFVLAIALAIQFCSCQPANGEVLTPGSGWVSFNYDSAGSFSSRTFEFTSTQSTSFKVADVFLPGERFEVRNLGTVLGLTSSPLSVSEDDFIEDPELALLDPKWSSLLLTLGPGTYNIDLRVVQNPHDAGMAFVKLDTIEAIPEPASAVVLGAGLALGYAARKRLRKSR